MRSIRVRATRNGPRPFPLNARALTETVPVWTAWIFMLEGGIQACDVGVRKPGK